MQVTHSEPARGNASCQIRAGASSWDSERRSVKFTWFDKRGRPCRGGEVPVEDLLQMVEVAVKQGDIDPKEVATMLARVL